MSRKLTLSETIYYYRENKNLSRKRFAREMKISPNTVEKLENAEVRNPRLETMDKLSVGMGIPKYELWAALRREV